MSETTIRMDCEDVMNLVRSKYRVPEGEILNVEIIAKGGDFVHFPRSKRSKMQFRISDADILANVSRDYVVEYDITFDFGRVKWQKKLQDFAKKLVKDRGRVTDIYFADFRMAYNDFKTKEYVSKVGYPREPEKEKENE